MTPADCELPLLAMVPLLAVVFALAILAMIIPLIDLIARRCRNTRSMKHQSMPFAHTNLKEKTTFVLLQVSANHTKIVSRIASPGKIKDQGRVFPYHPIKKITKHNRFNPDSSPHAHPLCYWYRKSVFDRTIPSFKLPSADSQDQESELEAPKSDNANPQSEGESR